MRLWVLDITRHVIVAAMAETEEDAEGFAYRAWDDDQKGFVCETQEFPMVDGAYGPSWKVGNGTMVYAHGFTTTVKDALERVAQDAALRAREAEFQKQQLPMFEKPTGEDP